MIYLIALRARNATLVGVTADNQGIAAAASIYLERKYKKKRNTDFFRISITELLKVEKDLEEHFQVPVKTIKLSMQKKEVK